MKSPQPFSLPAVDTRFDIGEYEKEVRIPALGLGRGEDKTLHTCLQSFSPSYLRDLKGFFVLTRRILRL